MHQIEIKNLSFSYHSKKAGAADVLSDLSLSIQGKKSVGIIGANGVGKSTLLKLLVGLASGYRGELSVGGLAVEKKSLVEIRKMVGYLFQDSDSQLFMNTVYDDVSFGPRNYGLSDDKVKERTKQALESVKMEHLQKQHIYRLSGGEKKLAAIATLLSMEPLYLLADEPSVGLDPRNRQNLIKILHEIDAVKIIASHDLDLIWDTCSRVILLSGGKIVADGDAAHILRDKELLEAHGLLLPLSLSRS